MTAYLTHQLSIRAWPYHSTVTLHAPAAAMADQVWPGMGLLEAVDDHTCLLHVGAETPCALSWMITSVDADFTLTSGPPELVHALRTQAARSRLAIAAEDK